MVELIYSGDLREITKKDGESIDAARLKDVLTFLSKTYGKDALKTAKQALITVNSVRCFDAKEKIPDGAKVKFFPFCIGG